MDKLVFYTMILSGVVFGSIIYLRNQREVEPAWSKNYVEPPQPSLLAHLKQSEAWLFFLAAFLALVIIRS